MPNIKHCILVALLLLSSKTSLADESLTLGSNELPITLQTLLESAGRDNLIDLMQQGDANQAFILQNGSDNAAYLTQLGDSNEVNIQQFGSENQVELLQVGERNSASITQIGQGNQVQLNQLGNASFSIQQIADGAAIAITQY